MFNNIDLRYELFRRIGLRDDKIVMIRIPVEKLDTDILRLRSQNKFLKAKMAMSFSDLQPDAHEIIGEPVNTSLAKVYKENEPVEYIYEAPISADIVEFAGEADFINIKFIAQQQLALTKKDKKVPIKDLHDKTIEITLNTIFENQPELNAINELRAMEKS